MTIKPNHLRYQWAVIFSLIALAACSKPPPPTPILVPPSATSTVTTPPVEATPYPPLAVLSTPSQPPTLESEYPPPPFGFQPAATVTQGKDLGPYPYPPPGLVATPPPVTPTSPLAYPPPTEVTGPAPAPLLTASPSPTRPPQTAPTSTAFVERIPRPVLLTPGAYSGTVTLWHSWNEAQVQMLVEIVRAFQESYPDVSFDILAVPFDELKAKYEAAAYRGGGPSVLLGVSEWGPSFYQQHLVEDLSPFYSSEFLSEINPAALGTGRFQGGLIGLPYAMRGALLYRNRIILPETSSTFTDLVTAARNLNRFGVIGAYLERGSFFSTAHLYGLGGSLMDENGNPSFHRDNFRVAKDWLALLASFQDAGAADFNSNRDVQLFQEGKVGAIIDGSWNRNSLAQAIGVENLAIDPWSTVSGGRLSGYVQADSVYLNVNTGLRSSQDQLVSLQFISFLLHPEVQTRLAEVGFIPVNVSAQPRDELVRQAVQAFEGGTAYPVVGDERVRRVYWDLLDAALADVFQRGADPETALRQAYNDINSRLVELRTNP